MERRSCWPLILCLLIALSVGLVGFMHYKTKMMNTLKSEMEFVDAAVQDINLGMKNYGLESEHIQKQMDGLNKEVKELQDEVGKLNSAKEGKDKEVKECKDSVAALNNDIAAVEKEKTDTNGKFADEKTKRDEAVNGLKKQLQDPSPVCAHVKMSEKTKDEAVLKEFCPQFQAATKA